MTENCTRRRQCLPPALLPHPSWQPPNSRTSTLRRDDARAAGQPHLLQTPAGDTSHPVEVLRNDSCRLQEPAENAAESSTSRLPVQCRSCPRPPAPPFVRVRGTDFVTVAWYTPMAVEDSETSVFRYQVSFYGDANSVWQPCYEGREEMCTISGLTPGQHYRVRVLAMNVAGASGFSGESFFSTAPQPQLSIRDLHMDRESTTSSPCPGSAYQFREQAVNNIARSIWSAPGQVTTAGPEQPSGSTDLEPPAFDASRVHNGCGVVLRSKLEITSIPLPAVPVVPSAPQVLLKGSQSVKLRWESLDSEVVASYTLQFQRSDKNRGDLIQHSGQQTESHSGSAWVDAYIGSGLEHEVLTLEPDCRYCFRVLAHTKHGASPSDTTTVSTEAAHQDPICYLETLGPLPTIAQELPAGCRESTDTDSQLTTTGLSPPRPAAPDLIHKSATSISVVWRVGDNGATKGIEESRAGNVSYELEMAVPAVGKSEVIYAGHASWHEVKDLAPNCVYQFRVRAICSAGDMSSEWSPFSEVSVSAVSACSFLHQFMLVLSCQAWSLRISTLMASFGILFFVVAAICLR